MATSPYAAIRRSVYRFIKSLSSLTTTSPLTTRLEFVNKQFLSKCLTDKDSSAHADLWDALLLFTKRFPETWTQSQMSESKKNSPVKGLLSFLKAGCYGSGSKSYPAVLVLLAGLPDEVGLVGIVLN
jgi:hypothetical protein